MVGRNRNILLLIVVLSTLSILTLGASLILFFATPQPFGVRAPSRRQSRCAINSVDPVRS